MSEARPQPLAPAEPLAVPELARLALLRPGIWHAAFDVVTVDRIVTRRYVEARCFDRRKRVVFGGNTQGESEHGRMRGH
jgi:hypothetical protein